ncbi:hypothetical protein IM787_09205, partial [Ramlibacter sp. HM2]|nr:hypothetical protein [Ramlibacter pallidus]
MLHRPNPASLPRQRMSPAALAGSGLLHIGLVWLLLQYTPVQEAVRYVVYQATRPSPTAPSATATAPPPSAASPSSRAITPPSALGEPADPPAVFSMRPDSSVPLQTTDVLPEVDPPRQPRPRRQRRESPVPDAAPAPRLRTETELPLPAQPAPAPPLVPPPLPAPVP